jgi:acetylornithine deacetylase/succinyl-diaminopimelate desuccinylase-like protein
VASGFTDSHFTRDLGIQSYGFSPMLYLDGEARGVHGNNEVVHIERYRRAVSDYQAVIEAFVSSPAQ